MLIGEFRPGFRFDETLLILVTVENEQMLELELDAAQEAGLRPSSRSGVQQLICIKHRCTEGVSTGAGCR